MLTTLSNVKSSARRGSNTHLITTYEKLAVERRAANLLCGLNMWPKRIVPVSDCGDIAEHISDFHISIGIFFVPC